MLLLTDAVAPRTHPILRFPFGTGGHPVRGADPRNAAHRADNRAAPTLGASVRPVIALDHVVIAVSDWDRANAFYRDVLGGELISRGAGWCYRFGAQQLNVHGPGIDPHPVASERVRPGNSDLCFRWQGTVEEAVAHLERHGVPVVLGPVARHGANGDGMSVYFRDPDGSLLEFLTYDA